MTLILNSIKFNKIINNNLIGLITFIKVFFRSFFLTLRYGPSHFKDNEGRPIHYRTEYVIKIISLLIVRDIFKNLKKKKINLIKIEKKESIKNYIIWRIHLLNFEFVHFCVLLDYQFRKNYLQKYNKKFFELHSSLLY